MKKNKIFLFLSIFNLSSFFAFSNNDSLKINKSEFHLSLNTGISIGKNNITYDKSGRYIFGIDCLVEKNKFLYGIDFFSTNFRDRNYPYEKYGFIFSTLASHGLNNISIFWGRHFENNKNRKMNLNTLVGIGYQSYRRPNIIEPGKFCILYCPKIAVDGSQLIESMAINISLKGYIKTKKSIRGFGFFRINTSPIITFWSIGFGVDTNTTTIKLFK